MDKLKVSFEKSESGYRCCGSKIEKGWGRKKGGKSEGLRTLLRVSYRCEVLHDGEPVGHHDLGVPGAAGRHVELKLATARC